MVLLSREASDVKDERLTQLQFVRYEDIETFLDHYIETRGTRRLPMPYEGRFMLTPVDGIQYALAAAEIGRSPFGFYDLIGQAEQRVFSVSQNSDFLTRDSNRANSERVIFEFLRDGMQAQKPRRMDFMVLDPRLDEEIKVWARYQSIPEQRFRGDLDRSIGVLQAWLQRAADEHVQGLRVRLSRRMVFISMNFVDPQTPSGVLAFTTNLYEDQAQARPCVTLSKARHPEVFAHFYSAYETIYTSTTESRELAAGM